MSGRKRYNIPTVGSYSNRAPRSDYQGSPWLPSSSGGFNQSPFGAPSADNYQPRFNPASSGYGGVAYGGAPYKDPDVILKELGKCYLNSLSGGSAPPVGNGFAAPNYPRYGNSSNSRGYVQRGYNNSKRTRDSRSGNRDSQSSRTSSNNANQGKKQKLGNKPSSQQTAVTNGKANATAKTDSKKTNGDAGSAKNEASSEATNTRTKKNRKWSNPKQRKPTVHMIRSRYLQLNHNKFLDDNGRVVVAYLRQVIHTLCEKFHYSLTNGILVNHRNAIKLFQYELKTLLDKKFGTNNANEEIKKKKLDHLNDEKKIALEDHKKVYPKSTEEETAAREKLLNEVIDVLTADVYPEDLVPTPEDYVKDPSAENSKDDMIFEFQYKFLYLVYETIGYVLVGKKGTVEEKVKFHINNGFIPALLVEFVTSETFKPGDPITLPTVLANKVDRKHSYGPFHTPGPSVKITEYFFKTISAKLEANNELLETNILDFLKGKDKISTKAVRDLAKIILVFDKILSVVRFKLLNYTPHLNLSVEVKEGIFQELVQALYKDVLEVLVNGVPMAKRTFVDLEGAEDTAEPDSVKTEAMETEPVDKTETMDTA